MRLQYRIVNVFTRDSAKLSGNPLCVFETGHGLTTQQMQALALQFNLSETTFILPSDKADAHVRIFTPTFEMAFAGHPTLGTAHVVRSLHKRGDQLSLEMRVGVIPVTANMNIWELKANVASTRKPSASLTQIAAALGLSETDIAGQPLYVNTGSEQLIIPLAKASNVERLSITADRLREVTQDGSRAMVYVFAPNGESAVVSRFFFENGAAIVEDPATGSAAANLGGWYLANNGALPLRKVISQGDGMDRPSSLQLSIDKNRHVRVAGEVIDLGSGYVDI